MLYREQSCYQREDKPVIGARILLNNDSERASTPQDVHTGVVKHVVNTPRFQLRALAAGYQNVKNDVSAASNAGAPAGAPALEQEAETSLKNPMQDPT